jgi:hypothetical protein
MIRELQLYCQPESRVYSAQQLEALQSDIRSEQLSTQVAALYSTQQLFLQENAATAEGFVYTKKAFLQLCALAAPGLSRLMQDLSGTIPRRYDSLYDAQLAIRTFNSVLNTRFRSLERFMLVQNVTQKRILGFVPSRNYLLDSETWLDRILDSLRFFEREFVFSGARICELAAAVWLKSKQPAARVTINNNRVSIYDAAYYCNGESLNGVARGARALQFSLGILLGGFKTHGGIARHSNLNFESAFDEMLDKVATTQLPLNDVTRAMHSLSEKKLADNFSTMKSVRSIKRALCAQLTDFKVNTLIATRAVERALYGERSPDDYVEDSSFLASLTNRTWLDLLGHVLKDARGYAFSRREQIEQAIFDFLINHEGD